MSSIAEPCLKSKYPVNPNVKSVGVEVMTPDESEHDFILKVLRKTEWHLEGNHGAAQLMGLNPNMLRARMRKYGILN